MEPRAATKSGCWIRDSGDLAMLKENAIYSPKIGSGSHFFLI